MRFYSTNNKNLAVTFQDALFMGLAPDGGLFMPKIIPTLPSSFFDSLEVMSFQEIAFEVAKRFIGDEIPLSTLHDIISNAFTFDVQLIPLDNDIAVLELFHGPTLAFKDFGARFLAQVMSYFLEKHNKQVVVLVATSGDTGSAVAHGFYNIQSSRVVVLYPKGKVSEIQEKQFTTLGGNITALQIDGTFDDCQRLVKQAFIDPELNRRFNLTSGNLKNSLTKSNSKNTFLGLPKSAAADFGTNLTSANSINIGRLLPQMFYYFYAYGLVPDKRMPVVFSVPSGNFGNLTAGLLAKQMGLPVKRFIAATNVNRAIPEFLETGVYTPRSSKQTISSAMDVGDPSNFARMEDLYGGNEEAMRSDVIGFSFTDEETSLAILDVYDYYGYLLDPCSTVAYLGLKKYRTNLNGPVPFCNHQGIFLATAHPSKFIEIVEPIIGEKVEIPERLHVCFARQEKQTIKLANRFPDVKEFLLNFFSFALW